ncbi:hypothetical protein C8A05DRAFT_16497 [Staphylotrichum tortipilum]|uniref:Uncharacterized protein n=1 Tax=Staphylotrichum tortipilum TaxID=2831512 RepID=A0AAN6RSF3_9PEZI|nr:hypothetical protein C8A05DRAFT_16497 [Staphylotrichum longicolle]
MAAASPTPRDIRRLASDHDFVLGAHPPPRRLGWWPFMATHLSFAAALAAGIIFVVVAIAYTATLSKQALECPTWANSCPVAGGWTIANLGTVQGIITMVYLIGLFALAYAALMLCEATVWPLLQTQSFTINGLDACLSATRGSVMSAPAAIRDVRSVPAGVVLAAAVVVSVLPFAAPPLVGHAYSPTLKPVQLESNYTPGGGITELFAQINPPTSVIARLLAEYNSWANNPAAEPMPEYRDWYIDRRTLNDRGDFTAAAVKLQTTVECRPYQVHQLNRDNLLWNAFVTNMARANTSTRPAKNSTAEVWIRPQPQLTAWVDTFEFISDQRTQTTLIFAALNGTIEGGLPTPLALANLTSVSSIACAITIEASDAIITVGTPSPRVSALPILSSLSTLTLPPAPSAPSPNTGLNELLLWLTAAPLLTSPSIDGTQPMFTNSTTTHLPLPLTTTSDPQGQNTWTIPGLTAFIHLSVSALLQSTTPSSSSPQITIPTTPLLHSLSPHRIPLLLLPLLLALLITLALAFYTAHLHAKLSVPVMRRAGVGEVLKSAQTAWVREVVGADAARVFLLSELGGVGVRVGGEGEREGGGWGFVAGGCG